MKRSGFLVRGGPLKRSRRRKASAAEKAYMARVAQVGCIVCSRCLGICGTPAEVHHLKAGGGSKRASHWDTMPLCREHHRGDTGIHMLGQEGFEQMYGVTEVDLLSWFQQLMLTESERPDATGGTDGR